MDDHIRSVHGQSEKGNHVALWYQDLLYSTAGFRIQVPEPQVQRSTSKADIVRDQISRTPDYHPAIRVPEDRNGLTPVLVKTGFDRFIQGKTNEDVTRLAKLYDAPASLKSDVSEVLAFVYTFCSSSASDAARRWLNVKDEELSPIRSIAPAL